MKRDQVKTGVQVIVDAEGNMYHNEVGVIVEIMDEHWNGGRSICVHLDNFGNRYFAPEYLESLTQHMPQQPQFTMEMLTEHFEGFLNHLEESDPTGWEDDEQFIMAREAVNSAKLSLKNKISQE